MDLPSISFVYDFGWRFQFTVGCQHKWDRLFVERIGCKVLDLSYPSPGPIITLTLASILNPLLVGLVGGIAAAMGELSGYAVGATGRQALEGSRIYERFQALAQRRVGPALFVFAALPIPFDFAGISAGTVRYSLRHFLLYVAAGKVIRVTTLAFAGYYGMSWLLG